MQHFESFQGQTFFTFRTLPMENTLCRKILCDAAERKLWKQAFWPTFKCGHIKLVHLWATKDNFSWHQHSLPDASPIEHLWDIPNKSDPRRPHLATLMTHGIRLQLCQAHRQRSYIHASPGHCQVQSTVGPPQVGLAPGHPMDARLDWYPGNLEPGSMPWATLQQCLSGLCCQSGTHVNARSQGFPAEHYILLRWSGLFTSPVNGFNVVPVCFYL